MNNENKTKNLCIRINPDIHRKAKLFAYMNGLTLQSLIEMVLNDVINSGTMGWIKRLKEMELD